MASPVLDPTLPADNSPVVSGELRGQFQAIQDLFDGLNSKLFAVAPLGVTVSNPSSPSLRRDKSAHASPSPSHRR
jgi:hypothetical protein